MSVGRDLQLCYHVVQLHDIFRADQKVKQIIKGIIQHNFFQMFPIGSFELGEARWLESAYKIQSQTKVIGGHSNMGPHLRFPPASEISHSVPRIYGLLRKPRGGRVSMYSGRASPHCTPRLLLCRVLTLTGTRRTVCGTNWSP